jgi:hypothetical protein
MKYSKKEEMKNEKSQKKEEEKGTGKRSKGRA